MEYDTLHLSLSIGSEPELVMLVGDYFSEYSSIIQ